MKLMHLSSVALKKGDVLKPQEHGYCHLPESQGLEDILERYRPSDKIPRKESVYLFKTRNESLDFGAEGSDFLFVVECDDEVVKQRSDMNWISELDQGFENSEVLEEDYEEWELQMLAEGYWSGKPRTNEDEAVYEYRVRDAVITAVYEQEKKKQYSIRTPEI